jgi:hypothetical protein
MAFKPHRRACGSGRSPEPVSEHLFRDGPSFFSKTLVAQNGGFMVQKLVSDRLAFPRLMRSGAWSAELTHTTIYNGAHVFGKPSLVRTSSDLVNNGVGEANAVVKWRADKEDKAGRG